MFDMVRENFYYTVLLELGFLIGFYAVRLSFLLGCPVYCKELAPI